MTVLKIRPSLYHGHTIKKVRRQGSKQHLQTETEEDQQAEPRTALQTKEKIRTQPKTAQNKVFNNCLTSTRALFCSRTHQEDRRQTHRENPLPHKLQSRKDLTTGIFSTSERKCDCHSVWKDLQLISLPFPLQNPLQIHVPQNTHMHACTHAHTHSHM